MSDFQMSISDAIPVWFEEPENPFTTYRKEVAAWEARYEEAWELAGCPEDFDFHEEYPVRPEAA